MVELERIINTIPIAILTFDKHLRILSQNDNFCDFLKLERKQLKEKLLTEVLPRELIRKRLFMKRMKAVIPSGEPVELKEVECALASGTKILHVRALKTGQRKTDHGVLLIDDLTKRVQMMEELRQAQKMSALGQFVAGVAHEINNPLNIVTGNAQYLLEKFRNASGGNLSEMDFHDLWQTLEMINKHCMRCGEITRHLLMFGHRENGIQRRLVNMNALLEDVLSIFGRQLEFSQIKVEKKMADDLPAVSVDSSQMDQVFMNLILNARNAMSKGGTLSLATFKRGEHRVLIRISDTGEGIPKKILHRVFEPFFTTREVGKGTGLGLSIAYSIIKEHQGSIRIKSRVGEGTTVSISLPLPHQTKIPRQDG